MGKKLVASHVSDDSDQSVSYDSDHGEFDAGAVIKKYRDEFNVLCAEYQQSELTILEALDCANGDLTDARRELDRITKEGRG